MNTTAQERKTKAIELLKQLDIYECVKFNSLNFEFLFAVGSHFNFIIGVFFATLPLSFYLHA